MSTTATEFEALKARLKATWMSGDFDQIAQTYAPGAAGFIARLNLTPGASVLDVACGSGNLSFPAADAGAIVTGVDIAPNLVAAARARAGASGVKIKFDEGDAERLPYQDASFDVVVSMFGAMFAPRPEVVASELLRVCRPGGRIALANWTPEGFVGQLFKITGRHVTPPASMPSPLGWGDRATVRTRLLNGVTDLRLTHRLISFRLPMNPAGAVEFFRQWYGPTHKAFESLGESGRAALRHDLEELWSRANIATDGSTHVESEYLEVIGVRQ